MMIIQKVHRMFMKAHHTAGRKTFRIFSVDVLVGLVGKLGISFYDYFSSNKC